jgi:hypothetical protein
MVCTVICITALFIVGLVISVGVAFNWVSEIVARHVHQNQRKVLSQSYRVRNLAGVRNPAQVVRPHFDEGELRYYNLM